MLTVILQAAVAVAIAGFSVVAVLVARSLKIPGLQRSSWLITGVVYSVYAAINLFQVTIATAAFLGGPDSTLYRLYMQWAPVGNHSRTFLLFVLYILLGAIALGLWKRRTNPSLLLAGVVAIGLTVGGLLGFSEGGLEAARHFANTAVLDTAGFALLASVLLLAIHRDSMDRLLWLCLAAHGFRSILGVLYLTAMAWMDAPGTWTPPMWNIHLLRLVLVSLQITFAIHRLRLARRGIQVQGLMPLQDRRVTLI